MESKYSAETNVAKQIWETHQDAAYIQDQSHWRGVGRWQDDSKWQAIGRLSLERFVRIFRLLDEPNPFSGGNDLAMMEWGPGGGANLFAFAPHCRRYYGIDISRPNLQEAQRMIAEEGHGGVFAPTHLSESPSEILSLVKDPIDLFLSTAVFQHFPSPEYGIEVLRTVNRCCRMQAIGFVQIRYRDSKPRYKPIAKLEDYQKKHITANSYFIGDFWEILSECGFGPIFVDEIRNQNNYATFAFRKIRNV